MQEIAAQIELDKFGVKAMYLIGSTKNCTAGPMSDIDLLFHFDGDENQRDALKIWLDGWSRGIISIASLLSGLELPDEIIDLHIITDQDIKNKNSFATMIGSLNNRARLIKTRDNL